MKQTFMTLPVMTGDVSGVCSALYELGGMVVMHDPSGCNSTYNTHDEIRWYDEPSLIFLTGLNANDAIMGNDEKLIHDVVKAARAYQPKFITLCNSPIPYIIGTDFEALTRIIEEQTQIPTFYVATNAMHDYVHGASIALEKVIARFCEKRTSSRFCVNVLGTTPLDYTNKESVTHIMSWLKAQDWAVHNLSFGSSFTELQQAGEADVNLVVSAVGLPAAKWMAQHLGIPYVCGVPLSGHEETLKAALMSGFSQIAYDASYDEKADVVVLGDPVIAGTIATILKGYHISATFIATNEADAALGYRIDNEEDLMQTLKGKACVIGDSLYRYVCDEATNVLPLGHFALSGRLFLKDIPDLLAIDWREFYESQ